MTSPAGSAPDHGQASRRVRVTGPARRRTSTNSLGTGGTVGVPNPEDRVIDDLYLQSLMRAQLGLAVRIVVVLAVAMALLPALFAIDPELFDLRIAGIPMVWLILGVMIYPMLVLLGRTYVRRAERNEQHYIDLVRRRRGASGPGERQ